jgi:hypothetical protein
MSKKATLIPCIAALAFAPGCGDDGSAGVSRDEAKAPKLPPAERQAQLEKDPYDLRCRDLSDSITMSRATRMVQNALADDAKIADLNRLQASQSIYYAITEICKKKPGDFQPAQPAIASVRTGEYRADLGTP